MADTEQFLQDSRVDIDIEPLLKRGLQSGVSDEIDQKLFDILNPVVQAPSSSSASEVAKEIDALYTSAYDSKDKAEDFHNTLWKFYIAVVKKCRVGNEEQLDLLADTVKELKSMDRGTVEIWGEDVKVWDGLPMLGPAMRDAWNFTPRYDATDKDDELIGPWIAVNSFAARLLGAGTTSWSNLALWSLRDALENPLPDHFKAVISATMVAKQWTQEYASDALIAEGKKTEELSETDKRMLRPGELFKGESGFSEERWEFWTQRLEELSDKSLEYIIAMRGTEDTEE